MKGKIIPGAGLRGLKKYIEKSDAEHIAGSTAPKDFLRTCAALRELRPDCKIAAIHISISLPPGEPLTPARWQQAGEILMRELDMQDCEFQLVRHNDTQHDHCHLIACKIKPDGTLWNDSHSARRLHKACSEIEKEMGLQVTKTVEDHRQSGAAKPISDGALRMFQRTGTVPNKTKEAIAKRIRDERERANQPANCKSTIERAVDAEADRPADAADAEAIIANQTSSTTTEYRNRDSEREHSDVFMQHQTDQQRPEADEKAATEKDFQLTTETDMQKRNGAQAQEIDDEDQPPTLSGRLRAELREEAGKHIFDLYFQGRELPTFCYRPADRSLELLATPTPQNVAAFFDACSEKNMKPLALFGDSQFLQLAVAEAHKRGYPLDLSDPRVKAMNDQLTAAPAPGSVVSVSLNTATSTANMFTAVAEKSMRSARRHI